MFDNVRVGNMKMKQFLDWLSDYQFLAKDSDPCSQLRTTDKIIQVRCDGSRVGYGLYLEQRNTIRPE
jgi:hypothetical protein